MIRLAEAAFSRETYRYVVVVCAYNEEQNLKRLLPLLDPQNVLLVDDGSSDNGAEMARERGFEVISLPNRGGKTTALRTGIQWAREHGHDVVVVLDADGLPEDGAIKKLVEAVKNPEVGGASCRQLPIVRKGIIFPIEDVMWSVLFWGKEYQMRKWRSCYIGGIMLAFKSQYAEVEDLVNDDERIGYHLHAHGKRTVLVDDALIGFDVSERISQLLARRRRMFFGHIIQPWSGAPSRDRVISLIALARTVEERPSRFPWVLPAVIIEGIARAMAWSDYRHGRHSKYRRWVSATKIGRMANYNVFSG